MAPPASARRIDRLLAVSSATALLVGAGTGAHRRTAPWPEQERGASGEKAKPRLPLEFEERDGGLEVLELSPEDRALIAVELEASLDAKHGSIQDVDKAWAEEIQRRVDNVVAGRSRGRGDPVRTRGCAEAMTKAVVVEQEASDELAAWYEQDRAGVGVELLSASAAP